MTIYSIPPNTRKLETMYAFVSEDSEGRHGILATTINGHSFSMVTMEKENAIMLRLKAEQAQAMTGIKVKFVTLKVESMEDI